MRIRFLLSIALFCLVFNAWSGAAANPISNSPGVAYTESATEELWNGVVAEHHVAHPHAPNIDPQHHAGDPHHTGDPHHAGDPHHTGDPHHIGDPHHTDPGNPHHTGDIHHADDLHHSSDPHHLDDGHHHTGNHHDDPHHHAGPTHHNTPPHHHAGDPHSHTDPMHVMGLTITADSGGNHLLHVNETQLGDLNGDGYIDQNDVVAYFGHNSFSPAVSLGGDVNYVRFANGAEALILVDTAHLPENFNLSNALAQLSVSSIPASLPGDYNHDDAVDAADYVVWRKTLGQIGAGLAANGNGNDRIDQGDFDVWKSHFGSTSSTGVGGSSVPEPATIIILFAAFVAVTANGYRRRP